MDGPRYSSKIAYAILCQPGGNGWVEFLFNHARYLCRELHLESVIPDAPGHHLVRARDKKRETRTHPPMARGLDAVGRGGNKNAGRAIGEQSIGNELLRMIRVLLMQATEFHCSHQNHCISVRFSNRFRDSKSIDRAMATHEADMGTLNRVW